MTGPLMVGAGGIGSVALAAVVMRGIGRVSATELPVVADTFGSTAPMADRLDTAFVVPFELTSLLLLVAVVGAVALAKRKV